MDRKTLKKMVDEDEFGLLDSPDDAEVAVEDWTWGQIRAMAEFIATNTKTEG